MDGGNDAGATMQRRSWIVALVGLSSIAAAIGGYLAYRGRTEWNAHHGAATTVLIGSMVSALCATWWVSQITLDRRVRAGSAMHVAAIGVVFGLGAAVGHAVYARPTYARALQAIASGDMVRAERAGYGLLRESGTRGEGESVLDEIRLRRLGREPALPDVIHALGRPWRRRESRARLEALLRRAIERELDATARGERNAPQLEDLADMVGGYLPAERDRLRAEAALAQFASCEREHDVFCAARLSERARSGGVSEARIVAARARVVDAAQRYLRERWNELTAAAGDDRRATICPGLRSEAIAMLDVFGVDPSVSIRDIDARCGVYARPNE